MYITRIAVFHYEHVQGVPWEVAESAVIFECIQLLQKTKITLKRGKSAVFNGYKIKFNKMYIRCTKCLYISLFY